MKKTNTTLPVVKKAIVPIAGLGTRFLPLSRFIPKEFFSLVDAPILQYLIDEIKNSGIKEIIFVNRPEKKNELNYFKCEGKLKRELIKKGRRNVVKDLEKFEDTLKNISFKQIFQKKPLGAAHAVWQARNFVKNEPCAVLWADDLVESKVPCLAQLIKVFEKYEKPVVALYKIPKESFNFYGMTDGKKIEKNVFKINRFVEKPKIKESPSDLAVVGKYIITPEVFDKLGKISFASGLDISLTEVLSKMAEDGEDIYGCQFEGKWLECGNKLAYLKTNIYLSLKDPRFGKEIKKFIKEII
ncbi:MAG: sugar phosphate nucleotidyltransferase [Candidatus Pacebacteria bacterium]|nr:sugar phosphate nucleotidyltransferase [Candidatus Paceibacterota bacterium]